MAHLSLVGSFEPGTGSWSLTLGKTVQMIALWFQIIGRVYEADYQPPQSERFSGFRSAHPAHITYMKMRFWAENRLFRFSDYSNTEIAYKLFESE